MDLRQTTLMTDLELQVAADGLRLSLERAWGRQEPGSVSAIYDLARITAEAQVRALTLRPLHVVDQLVVFDPRAYDV